LAYAGAVFFRSINCPTSTDFVSYSSIFGDIFALLTANFCCFIVSLIIFFLEKCGIFTERKLSYLKYSSIISFKNCPRYRLLIGECIGFDFTEIGASGCLFLIELSYPKVSDF